MQLIGGYIIKNFKILTILLIFTATILIACNDKSLFIKTITKNKNETLYSAIYKNGKEEKIGEFTSDKIEIFKADLMDFSLKKENNKLKNTLVHTKLTDTNGKEINTSEKMKEILKLCADKIDHPIWELSIIQDNEEYFVFVKLNVNLHDPCILYHYNNSKNILDKIIQWEDVDLIGISLK